MGRKSLRLAHRVRCPRLFNSSLSGIEQAFIEYYSALAFFVIVPSPTAEIKYLKCSTSMLDAATIKGGTVADEKNNDQSYLSNNPNYVPDPEIEEFMEEEILRAPKDPELLAHRLRDNTAASPRDAGGDVDASWEDVNDSGSESVSGDNPTPDQSDVEENAHAVGVSFEDNEELEFEEKIEKRDRNRFELDESSKEGDTI